MRRAGLGARVTFVFKAVSQVTLPWTVWHLWLPVAAHRRQWWDPPRGRIQLTLVPRLIIKSAFVKLELPEDVFPERTSVFCDLWNSLKGED